MRKEDLEIAVDGAAQTAAARTPADPGKPTFRHIFAIGEFRALWLAQLLSVAGDQLARVAMTVLVYDRTHSAFWTALTYAVTFLPWVIGGLALSGLADRLPRRQVMVACDIARLVLVCLMALVSLKVPPAGGAVDHGGAALRRDAARLAVQVGAVRDDARHPDRGAVRSRYSGHADHHSDRHGLGLRAGRGSGAFMGVRTALLVDAATFAASALLIRFWVRHRPAAAQSAAGGRPRPSQLAEIAAGVRLVFGDRTLRTLMLLGWLVAFYVVPMGLAAPYAASLHTSLPIPISTGLVFAAGPFGTAVGAVIFGRMVPPAARQRWMGPMAIGRLWRAAVLRAAAGPDGRAADHCRVRGVRLLPAGGQRCLCRRSAARAPRPGFRPGQRRHAGNTGPVDRPRRRGSRPRTRSRLPLPSPSAAA